MGKGVNDSEAVFTAHTAAYCVLCVYDVGAGLRKAAPCCCKGRISFLCKIRMKRETVDYTLPGTSGCVGRHREGSSLPKGRLGTYTLAATGDEERQLSVAVASTITWISDCDGQLSRDTEIHVDRLFNK